MYLAGYIGLNIDATQSLFRSLTPFHLLSSAAILIYFEETKNKHFYIHLITSYLVGFFIEVAGVNTGLIFGEYAYGETLGWKIWNTPLMIGVNWFLLSFAIGKVLNSLSEKFNPISNPIMFATLGAAGMTGLDFLAEPPAIQHDMWSWTQGLPPTQNYIGWFVVSWFLMFLFSKLGLKSKNPLAPWILALQFLFFLAQYLW